MLKNFYNHYNKPYEGKFFYEHDIAVRSTAYGPAVAKEFALWQDYYANAKDDKNFLVCEQGDVNGNPVRNGSFYGSIKKCVGRETYAGERSVLRPLLLGNLLFEVQSNGYVLLNGKRRFDAGSEIKGWAISSLPGEEDVLFIIAKPVGSREMTLTGYEIKGDDLTGEPVASVKLNAVLGGNSRMVCYGRHIFISHGSSLLYYYFTGGGLEYVPVGGFGRNEGKKWCSHVGKIFAADRSHVFWTADEDIYYITVGRPDKVARLPADAGGKTLGLTAYGGELYAACRAGGRSVLYRYGNLDGAEAEKKVMAEDAGGIAVLAREGEATRCIILSSSGKRAEDAVFGNGKRVNASVGTEAAGVFCFGNELYENAYYVGLLDGRPICILQ